MPKISERARTQRRQALVDAAWRCAARRGFHATSVDDVCLEAGVSKGAFYGYFRSKEDLLLALLDDDARLTEAVIAEVTAGTPAGRSTLAALAEAMLERASNPARVQLRADLWASMLSQPRVRERFVEVVRRRRELLLEAIQPALPAAADEDGVPARALASILVALADGLTLHGGLDPQAFRWPRVRRAIDVLLRSVPTAAAASAGDGEVRSAAASPMPAPGGTA